MTVVEREVSPSETSTLKTVLYTKKELRSLLTDEAFWSQARLPITRHRVASQIQNPRADENDILLIAAYHSGKLVAYLGILPDEIKDPVAGCIKFGWISTWWADTESEQRLAGLKLLFAAMSKYSNRLAASSPANEAARAYEGSGRFLAYGRCNRSYFFVSPPLSSGLPGKIARWFLGKKNVSLYGKLVAGHGLEILITDSFDMEMESFLTGWAAEDPFQRDSEYWKWVFQYPWVSTADGDRIAQERYVFTAFAKDFLQMPIFVKRRGIIIAFLVMTLRAGRLTLKHAYYDSSNLNEVVVALLSVIAKINPWLFICGDYDLDFRLRKYRAMYITRLSRESVVYRTKSLSVSSWSWAPQPGTGDSIFT